MSKRTKPCEVCGGPGGHHGSNGPFRINKKTGREEAVWVCAACASKAVFSDVALDDEEIDGKTIN
jgi:hypothetical protein